MRIVAVADTHLYHADLKQQAVRDVLGSPGGAPEYSPGRVLEPGE
jgi:hypothetical protein